VTALIMKLMTPPNNCK